VTPLHLASVNSHIEIVLKQGANVEATMTKVGLHVKKYYEMGAEDCIAIVAV
jgi:hypothetical protein